MSLLSVLMSDEWYAVVVSGVVGRTVRCTEWYAVVDSGVAGRVVRCLARM